MSHSLYRAVAIRIFLIFPCNGPDLWRIIPEVRKERNHQCLPPCFHSPPWISCPQTLKTCCALHSIHPCQYNHGNSTQPTKKQVFVMSPVAVQHLQTTVSQGVKVCPSLWGHFKISVIFCGLCGDDFHQILLFPASYHLLKLAAVADAPPLECPVLWNGSCTFICSTLCEAESAAAPSPLVVTMQAWDTALLPRILGGDCEATSQQS